APTPPSLAVCAVCGVTAYYSATLSASTVTPASTPAPRRRPMRSCTPSTTSSPNHRTPSLPGRRLPPLTRAPAPQSRPTSRPGTIRPRHPLRRKALHEAGPELTHHLRVHGVRVRRSRRHRHFEHLHERAVLRPYAHRTVEAHVGRPRHHRHRTHPQRRPPHRRGHLDRVVDVDVSVTGGGCRGRSSSASTVR